MTITIGLVLICILSLLAWALSSNGNIKTLGLAIFTASLAAIFVVGPRWIR